MSDTPTIRMAFNSHGLGDVVHCCHAMKLYQSRGYDVAIQIEPNKRWAWEAAGIPIYHGDGLPVHPYYYPSDFFDLSKPDHTHSKIAHLFEVSALPKLGDKPDVWQAVCNMPIDATSAVSSRAMDDATKFLEGLPHPIILLHSKGTNWQEEKSIPDGTAFQLIRNLLETGGSVVTLDWDGRAPTLGHDRVRGIKPNWHHISLEEFGALCILADLFIGVDSGPFHLAGWFDIPTLYVSRKIPPVRCCLPDPMATYLVPAKDHEHWATRGDEWRFVEFAGLEATAEDITKAAAAILNGGEHITVRAADLVPIGDHDMVNFDAKDIPGKYTYRRVGHDERQMELLPDGRIGLGAAGCERSWTLEHTSAGSILNIYGDRDRHTIQLRLGSDGVIRGAWLVHEKMPIELIRTEREAAREMTADLTNGQINHWTPSQAAKVFPSYHPAWNYAVGTRGNGAAWLLDPKIERSDLDACSQDHEDWMYPKLQVPPGAVCLDLASFVGTVAVWWAKRGAKVIGVEPIPTIRDTLYRNLILNQVTDAVTVIPKAFGDHFGEVGMSVESYNSMIKPGGKCLVELTTVDCELLPTLTRLDIVKLDVEGAECEVITGAFETLRKFKPKLIIEVHCHLPGRQDNGAILGHQLSQLGYSTSRIWTNTDQYYYVQADPIYKP